MLKWQSVLKAGRCSIICNWIILLWWCSFWKLPQLLWRQDFNPSVHSRLHVHIEWNFPQKQSIKLLSATMQNTWCLRFNQKNIQYYIMTSEFLAKTRWNMHLAWQIQIILSITNLVTSCVPFFTSTFIIYFRFQSIYHTIARQAHRHDHTIYCTFFFSFLKDQG